MIIDEIEEKKYDFRSRHGWEPNAIYMNIWHRVKLAQEMEMVCLIDVDHCCGMLIKQSLEKEMYVALV